MNAATFVENQAQIVHFWKGERVRFRRTGWSKEIGLIHVRSLLPKMDKQRIGNAFNISDLPSSLVISD
jgi:hypothetical protein